MNRSHVTLPQIIAATSTRHASLVPESAAYLVLALCDAIGCLPLAVPDAAIELSADGTVTVSEKGKVQQGPEAARAMRALLARLLVMTTGPVARLATVAKPRELSMEKGVDTFVVELEAALVPLNRAASKRNLGRLARETLRAVQSGSLALHLRARAAAKEAAAAAPAPAPLAPLMVAPNPAAKPSIVAPEPARVAPEPAPVAFAPAAITFEPGPVALAPAPVALAPAAITFDPGPVALAPAPIAPEPTPTAIEPAPVAQEPTPTVIELAPVTPEATPTALEPAPVVQEPTPTVIELAPVAPEPTPVAIELAPVAPELTPAAIEPATPMTPPPLATSAPGKLNSFSQITPTTPGLGLETFVTEAQIDLGVFGATPTIQHGDDIAVEPAEATSGHESPVFELANTQTVSCEPTQLSAKNVQLDPTPRTPTPDMTTRIRSTQRHVRPVEAHSAEITLASAGVEPISDATLEPPAPSAPEGTPAANALFVALEQAISESALYEFTDCHDGQTQSIPKYDQTLPGLAPITFVPVEDEAEPLQSFEYQLVTPSALPRVAVVQASATEMADASELDDIADEPEELSSRLLVTASPSRAIIVQSASPCGEVEPWTQTLRVLEAPNEKPGRVDELLGTFGRPEEGEEAMLRKTASSLKELAGLEPTPYAPSVLPAIRVPALTNRNSPAWLPDDPRQAPMLEPAPLVKASRSWRARLMIPFALLFAYLAGFAAVHWRLPELVMHRMHSKEPAGAPAQAAAEQEVYLEP